MQMTGALERDSSARQPEVHASLVKKKRSRGRNAGIRNECKATLETSVREKERRTQRDEKKGREREKTVSKDLPC